MAVAKSADFGESRMEARTFAIISLPRSGSTYLALSLSALQDVTTDFECKYPVTDRPYVKLKSDVHLFLNEADYEQLLFSRIGRPTPLIGSKLVLDIDPYAPTDIDKIFERIPQHVPVVLLTRPPTEILLSMLRGAVNALRDKSAKGVLADTLRRNDISPLPNDRTFDQVNTSEFLNNRAICIETLHYLNQKLTARGNFMHLEYSDISRRLEEVASFVGSSATAQEIETVRQNPATFKLGPDDPRQWARERTNIGSLSFLFEGYPLEGPLCRAMAAVVALRDRATSAWHRPSPDA